MEHDRGYNGALPGVDGAASELFWSRGAAMELPWGVVGVAKLFFISFGAAPLELFGGSDARGSRRQRHNGCIVASLHHRGRRRSCNVAFMEAPTMGAV